MTQRAYPVWRDKNTLLADGNVYNVADPVVTIRAHEHFCTACGDWWEHADAECAEQNIESDYECPEHAGSQEVRD